MAPGYGFGKQIGVGAALPVTSIIDVMDESVGLRDEIVDQNGLKGTRSHSDNRVAVSRSRVNGGLSLSPSIKDLQFFLPRILGGAAAPPSYPQAEVIPTFYVVTDKVAKVHTFAGVGVNRATIRGTSGQAILMDLDCIGQTEAVGNAGTFPALAPTETAADMPLMFHGVTATRAGVARQFGDFTLTIDNFIDADRFLNNQHLTATTATDLQIGISLTEPYGDYPADYDNTSVAVVLVFTVSTYVVTFTMPKVKFPRNTPGGGGRAEIVLPLNGFARSSGGPRTELAATIAGP